MLAFLLFRGLHVETNILDMLVSRNSRDESLLQIGSRLLDSGSSKLRFVLAGASRERVLEAGRTLRSRLQSQAPLLTLMEIPDSRSLSEHFLPVLSASRIFLLDRQQQEMLSRPDAAAVLSRRILSTLTSPLGTFSAQFLEFDPLLLLQDRLLRSIPSDFGTPSDGFLLKEQAGSTVLTLPAETKESGLDRHLQEQLSAFLEQTTQELNREYPDVETRWSGMIRFAGSSAGRMESEVRQLSTLATLATVGIVMFAFFSLTPLLLSCLSAASGILCGIFLVQTVFGSVHLLTLGFGVSLMGAGVDYAMFYLCAHVFGSRSTEDIRRLKPLRSVIVPISIGVLTSVLAFLALYSTGFPGLQELSVFSIGSLAASYAGVVLLFPNVLRKPASGSHEPIVRLSLALLSLQKKCAAFILRPIPLLFCIAVSLYGISRLQSNDDIRLLQLPEQRLIDDEVWIQQRSGMGLPSAYLFISGKDSAEVLERNAQATEMLQSLRDAHKVDSFLSLSSQLPPPSAQRRSAEIYRAFISAQHQKLEQSLSDIGYSPALLQKVFDVEKQKPLDIQALLALREGSYLGELFLGQAGNRFWTVIPLIGEIDKSAVISKFSGSDDVSFYEHTAEISKLFSSYRQRSILFVILAYSLIALLFIKRYGAAAGCRAFLPSAFSAFFCLATMGFLSIPINFFGVLGLIIVLGLSVDYSVFFAEPDTELRASSPAVLLAAVTTIVTFGLLVFSSVPVLSAFGAVISLGIGFSFWLTPLAKL
jgi:predicted exporter